MIGTGHTRAAVVQAAPVAFDPDASIEKAIGLAGAAAAAGAQLVVFPEAFISCYPRGLDFGAVVGDRSTEGREMFRRYWEAAIDLPGAHADALAATTRDLGLYLVIGVIERDGGTLYCTVLLYDPAGQLLGKHRKLMPTGTERLIWGTGDGSTLAAYDTPIGTISAAICWENYMPLLRMALYEQNVQFWCAPTADARDSWIASMRHIAVEGRCFVLSSNQYAERSSYPDDYPPVRADGPALLTRGGSCIVDPFGELIAGPCYEGETILYADLDRADTIRGKYDFDVVGHYARPDVFSLHVDRRPRQTVSSSELSPSPAETRLAGAAVSLVDNQQPVAP